MRAREKMKRLIANVFTCRLRNIRTNFVLYVLPAQSKRRGLNSVGKVARTPCLSSDPAVFSAFCLWWVVVALSLNVQFLKRVSSRTSSTLYRFRTVCAKWIVYRDPQRMLFAYLDSDEFFLGERSLRSVESWKMAGLINGFQKLITIDSISCRV